MGEYFAVPGDALGVIEEYVPLRNAYERDGVIRTKVVGWAKADPLKHEVAVVEARPVAVPRGGDVVHAVVALLREAVAYVDIFYNETRNALYPVPFRGVLHVSEVSNERLRGLGEAFGYGDVIRARVLSERPPYHLSTKGGEFGLILARCPRCLSPLRKRGLWLYCQNCRRVYRRRKISRHYALK